MIDNGSFVGFEVVQTYHNLAGKLLSDDEMIEYYSELAGKVNKDCYIEYFTGITLINDKGVFTKELKEIPLKLSPTPNINRRHRGNPLDVVSLLEDGRFYNELSDEERMELDKAGEEDFTNFILSHLLD